MQSTQEIRDRRSGKVQAACKRCRRMKRKCDAKRPSCRLCDAVSAFCEYETENAVESRTAALKRRHRKLEEHADDIAEKLHWLKSLSTNDAARCFALLRSADDPVTTLRSLNRGMFSSSRPSTSRRLSARATASAHLPTETGVHEIELAVQNPFCYPLLGPIDYPPFFETESFYKSIDNSPNSGALLVKDDPFMRAVSSLSKSLVLPPLCDERLLDLDIAYWTAIPISNGLAASMISLYLQFEHPVYGLFDPDLFVGDLIDCNLRFCSPLLVSSVLAWACHTFGVNETSAGPFAHVFFESSRTLLLAEQYTDHILNVASLMVMSVCCIDTGKDALAQKLIRDGIGMGGRLSLFTETRHPVYDHAALYPGEWLSAASWIAWGVFNLSSLFALYFRDTTPGTCTRFPPPLPIPGIDHLGQSGFIGKPLPHYVGETWTALCKFWSIVHEVELVFCSSQTPILERVSISMAEQIFLKVLAVTSFLPPTMARSDGMPHHVHLFHIYLHAFIMDIFRPFLRPNPRLGAAAARYGSPWDIFTCSSKHLRDLSMSYYSKHRATPAAHICYWIHAPVWGINAAITLPKYPQQQADVVFYVQSCYELLQSHPVLETFVKGSLHMAVRAKVLSARAARNLVASITRVGEQHDDELDHKEAKWVVNLEVAIDNPKAAISDVLSEEFQRMIIVEDLGLNPFD